MRRDYFKALTNPKPDFSCDSKQQALTSPDSKNVRRQVSEQLACV